MKPLRLLFCSVLATFAGFGVAQKQQQPQPNLQPCGRGLSPCPNGQTCKKLDSFCLDLSNQGNCIGSCVISTPASQPPKQTALPSNRSNRPQGFRQCPSTVKCNRGAVCIPSLSREGAYMCLVPDEDCGGAIFRKSCPQGKACVADPRYTCQNGICDGTDGLCVNPWNRIAIQWKFGEEYSSEWSTGVVFFILGLGFESRSHFLPSVVYITLLDLCMVWLHINAKDFRVCRWLLFPNSSFQWISYISFVFKQSVW